MPGHEAWTWTTICGDSCWKPKSKVILSPPSSRVLRTWKAGECAQRAKRLANSGQSLAFRVDITESALADAEDFAGYVRSEKRDPVGAERWWNGLLDAL